MQVCFSFHICFRGFNSCLMHACREEPGDDTRERCTHIIIESYVYEQYRDSVETYRLSF